MNSGWWLSFIRWFDSRAEITGKGGKDQCNVDWVRCLPFFFLHIACLNVFWVGFSYTAFFLAGSLYFLRMFAITGFYHRYFSHRAFKTSRWVQLIFAIIGASSAQRGPLWWAAHHRHHHRYSDSPEDIHSPVQSGFFWSHMFWFTNRSNFKTKSHLISDLNHFPELQWIDRFDIVIPVILGVHLFITGEIFQNYFPELETNGPQLLVWGIISTVFLFHATCSTNSIAHLFGTKRYKTGDSSRNNFWIALLTLGEGWHNNHHHYPSSVQQGFYWWEIDVTYWILFIMSKLGLVWGLRLVPNKIK
tara:strand:+ start:4726 stop:5634 length:909 start_codon:yes stop_codon:yes gene_type:complete